jgi:hypothetical protein
MLNVQVTCICNYKYCKPTFSRIGTRHSSRAVEDLWLFNSASWRPLTVLHTVQSIVDRSQILRSFTAQIDWLKIFNRSTYCTVLSRAVRSLTAQIGRLGIFRCCTLCTYLNYICSRWNNVNTITMKMEGSYINISMKTLQTYVACLGM